MKIPRNPFRLGSSFSSTSTSNSSLSNRPNGNDNHRAPLLDHVYSAPQYHQQHQHQYDFHLGNNYDYSAEYGNSHHRNNNNNNDNNNYGNNHSTRINNDSNYGNDANDFHGHPGTRGEKNESNRHRRRLGRENLASAAAWAELQESNGLNVDDVVPAHGGRTVDDDLVDPELLEDLRFHIASTCARLLQGKVDLHAALSRRFIELKGEASTRRGHTDRYRFLGAGAM
mmetsp:Transcript_49252/g.97422  ORF Transcript_49252/g.97422 Transcript_49252/m.97422 type:complete len:227 (-) Transcript_49252:92-772(-)